MRLVVVWAVFFAFCVAYLVWLQFNGYVSPSMLSFSGDAILAAEGRTAFAEIATVYPPLPHLLALAVAYVTPGPALPGAVAAAVAGGLFAAGLFRALRLAGIGSATAIAVALLMVANPFFLRALADGPATMLLLFAVLMFAQGLFSLARDGTAQDVMAVALALVLLAFSHQYGVVLAVSSLPFLALAAPRHLVARAPGGLFLTLLFPVGFCLLAFAYVGWIFAGSAWAFLGQTDGTLPEPSSGADSVRSVLFACVAIGLVSPTLPALLARAGRQRVLTTPALALGGTILVAIALATAAGSTLALLLSLSPLVAIAGACGARWPDSRNRGAMVLALAALGVVGAIPAYSIVADTSEAAWRQATLGSVTNQGNDLQAVSGFLDDRHDVLLDATTHPELVALRGTSRGWTVPGDPGFDLALLSSEPSHRFVVATDSSADLIVHDRIGRAFPRFYNEGAPGYRLVYDSDGWRIYERAPAESGED